MCVFLYGRYRGVGEGSGIIEYLFVRGAKIGVTLLVLHREATAFPHISPSSSASRTIGTFFVCVVDAFGIGFDWRQFAEQPAKVAKMLDRCLPFVECDGPPFVDKFLRRHLLTVCLCREGCPILPERCDLSGDGLAIGTYARITGPFGTKISRLTRFKSMCSIPPNETKVSACWWGSRHSARLDII